MVHDEHMTTITRPLDPTTRSCPWLLLLLLLLWVMAFRSSGGSDVRRRRPSYVDVVGCHRACGSY